MRIYGRVKIEHSSCQKFTVALWMILLDKRVTHNRLAEQSNPDPGWEAPSREACRLPASWPAPPSQRRKQNLGKQSGHFLRGSHSSNPGSRIDWLGLQSRELPDPKISLQKVFCSTDFKGFNVDPLWWGVGHPIPSNVGSNWWESGLKGEQAWPASTSTRRRRGRREAGGKGGGEAATDKIF